MPAPAGTGPDPSGSGAAGHHVAEGLGEVCEAVAGAEQPTAMMTATLHAAALKRPCPHMPAPPPRRPRRGKIRDRARLRGSWPDAAQSRRGYFASVA